MLPPSFCPAAGSVVGTAYIRQCICRNSSSICVALMYHSFTPSAALEIPMHPLCTEGKAARLRMSCRAHRCCRAGALRRPSQQARISLAPRQPHQDGSASCKEDLAALFLRPHSASRRGPRAHRAAHSRLFCTADREAGKVPVQLHIHAGPSAAVFKLQLFAN